MIKISSYKRVSIKFGIVCGMVVTLCGAINAILGTVQKWNETFVKKTETELAVAYDQPTEGEWVLEQRISGDAPPGTTITKGITVPEAPVLDEDVPLPVPVEDVPEEEPVSMTSAPEEDYLSTTGWLVVTLLGGGMMVFLMKAHKNDTLSRIKDDREPDNIV